MTGDFMSEMPLRRLERVITRAEYYSRVMNPFPGERGKSFYYSSGSYDEGLYWQHKELVCFPSSARAANVDTMYWLMKIVYDQTSEEVFDYTDTVRRDNSTAYKSKPAGPPELVKFKIRESFYHRVSKKCAGGEREMLQDFVFLERKLERLDDLTKDLSRWAASGEDMVVTCLSQDFPCAGLGRTVIPNSVLSSYVRDGLTLDGLTKRLKCKLCGQRQARLMPSLG